MTHRIAVMNLPAVYSVHQTPPFFVAGVQFSTWVASYEGCTLAVCVHRWEAEEVCRVHAEYEEFVAA